MSKAYAIRNCMSMLVRANMARPSGKPYGHCTLRHGLPSSPTRSMVQRACVRSAAGRSWGCTERKVIVSNVRFASNGCSERLSNQLIWLARFLRLWGGHGLGVMTGWAPRNNDATTMIISHCIYFPFGLWLPADAARVVLGPPSVESRWTPLIWIHYCITPCKQRLGDYG